MDKAQKNEPDAAAEHTDGQPAEQSSHKNQTMVVGIGASAGGLAALQAFFEAVAPDLGVAFVVIVHLHPAHRSELAAILQAHTAMPVVQVTATVGLEPNHVYVIPPNQQLFATDHQLSLADFQEQRGLRMPIDFFFARWRKRMAMALRWCFPVVVVTAPVASRP